MLLSELPNPPQPWRPCIPESPSQRLRLVRCSLVMPLPRRRNLRSPSFSSPGSPSKNSALLPEKRPSSSKRALNENWRCKAVPPRMRESSASDPEEPPPLWWTARRRARAAWREVSSWVPRRARNVVLLNLVVLVFATNISIVKEAQTMLDPDLFNMLRFSISAIPFVPYLLKALKDTKVFMRGAELGFWVTLGYLSQSTGLITADAGRASFISGLTVIIVPFLDGVLGAEIPSYTWLGVFLSIIGVGILELSGSPPCVGDLLTLLSAFCFAIHMIRTEHISRNMKKANFLALVGCQVLVVALVSSASFIVKFFIQNAELWKLKLQPSTELFSIMASFPWLAIIYSGMLSTTFCLWAELVAMRYVSATETALIYGLEPVWGAAFAWAMLGERWGITGFVGAIFIIAGSLMVQILGSFTDVSQGGSYQMNS